MVRPADSTGAAAATAQVRFDIDTVITRAARVSAEVPGGRPWRVQSPTTSRRHNRMSSPSQGMSSWACMRCTSLFSLSVLACRAGHTFYCVRDGSLDGVQCSDELPSVLFLQWHDYQSSTLRRLPLPHNRRDCPKAGADGEGWAGGQEGIRLRHRQEGKPGVRRDGLGPLWTGTLRRCDLRLRLFALSCMICHRLLYSTPVPNG